MELTWVEIAASVIMGLAADCAFVFAVKKNYWSDLEEQR